MSGLFPFFARLPAALARGARKAARWLLYVLLVLAAVHLLATFITGRMLKAELDRLRDSGEPLTLAELAPRVPPGEVNAADIYQQAFDSLRVSDSESLELEDFNRVDDPEWLALAQRVVSDNAEYYSLLEEASRTPACAFPVDWEAGINAQFPHLGKMRQVARMLRVRAEVLAADGDTDEAIASCAVAFRMAEHIQMEPTLIAPLVGIALEGIQMPALERALSAGSPSPEAAHKLFNELGALDETDPMARTMLGERAFGLSFFRDLRQLSWRELAKEDSFFGNQLPWKAVCYRGYVSPIGRPLLNLDQLSYLRAWEAANEAIQLPWPQSRDRMRAAQKAVESLPIYRSVLTRMGLPVLERGRLAQTRGSAQLRAIQIALAVVAYRSEHGSLPASLDEVAQVGWELPADPFGGGQYRYRKEGNGFVVWSIGPDLDDDNAEVDVRDLRLRDREARDELDYDVVFRCLGPGEEPEIAEREPPVTHSSGLRGPGANERE